MFPFGSVLNNTRTFIHNTNVWYTLATIKKKTANRMLKIYEFFGEINVENLR